LADLARKKKRRTQAGIYSPALIDVTHEKLAATSANLAYISIGGSRRLATLLRDLPKAARN